MALQIFLNGLITGAIYALVAAGFNLVYNVHRFFYIAHGGVLAVGAFAFYSFSQLLKLNLILSFVFSLLAVFLLGSFIELLIHKPLRKRKGTSLLFFLASTSVFILIQNTLLLIFGPSIRTFKLPIQKSLEIAGANITPIQVGIFFTSVFVFLFLFLFLSKTILGRAIRAVSNDPLTSSLVGINVENIYLILINLSAVLGCIAGILISLEQDLRFDMGLHVMLMGIVASIIGGIGNISMAVVGGFFLGIIGNVGSYFFPSGFKQVFVFVVLIVFLLIRPQGLFGINLTEND